MMFQGQKVVIFLLLICGPLTVSGFTTNQLQRATNQVQTIFRTRGQHAYVIKFTSTQCAQLTDEDISTALNGEDINAVQNAMNSQTIYSGTQMVMAKYRDLGDNKREHAEHRLLYPPEGSNVSPVEDLLNKPPAAGCVLFYTYYSPCNAFCTKPGGPFNIAKRLNVFSRYNNRAFVYTKVYSEKPIKNCCPVGRLKSIGDQIPLYRCDNNNCIKCFDNYLFNDNCLA